MGAVAGRRFVRPSFFSGRVISVHKNAQRHMYNRIGNLLLIGGSGSCGTKMLAKVLSLHPEMYGHPGYESVPAPYYLGAWAEQHLPMMLEKKERKWAKWLLDATPDNCLWFESIRQAIANAHADCRMAYMHIQRHEDRTVESILRRGELTWTCLPECTNRDTVKSFVRMANGLGNDLARRVKGIRVHFDTLVMDPGPVLDGLCDWLNIGPPTKEMLSFPFDKTKSAFYAG